MVLGEGQKLKLACDHEPPADLIEQIRRDKREIIAFLSSLKDSRTPAAKTKCLVLELEVGGRRITAIDTVSTSIENAIKRERERWGNQLSRVWARGGALIWKHPHFNITEQ